MVKVKNPDELEKIYNDQIGKLKEKITLLHCENRDHEYINLFLGMGIPKYCIYVAGDTVLIMNDDDGFKWGIYSRGLVDYNYTIHNTDNGIRIEFS